MCMNFKKYYAQKVSLVDVDVLNSQYKDIFFIH